MRTKSLSIGALLGAILLLAGCSSSGPLPSTDNSFYALTNALSDRTANFDTAQSSGDPTAYNLALIDTVYRAAVEDDLGYSFDATLRDAIVADDLNRRGPLINAINAIGNDPQPYVEHGLVSAQTAALARAYVRNSTWGELNGAKLATPEVAARLHDFRACQAANAQHTCTPAQLDPFLRATDTSYQEALRTTLEDPQFGAAAYRVNLFYAWYDAGLLTTPDGQKPDFSASPAFDQTAFQLNNPAIEERISSFRILAQARAERAGS